MWSLDPRPSGQDVSFLETRGRVDYSLLSPRHDLLEGSRVLQGFAVLFLALPENIKTGG